MSTSLGLILLVIVMTTFSQHHVDAGTDRENLCSLHPRAAAKSTCVDVTYAMQRSSALYRIVKTTVVLLDETVFVLVDPPTVTELNDFHIEVTSYYVELNKLLESLRRHTSSTDYITIERPIVAISSKVGAFYKKLISAIAAVSVLVDSLARLRGSIYLEMMLAFGGISRDAFNETSKPMEGGGDNSSLRSLTEIYAEAKYVSVNLRDLLILWKGRCGACTTGALPSEPQPKEDKLSIAPFIVRGAHDDSGFYKIEALKRTYYIQAGHRFQVGCMIEGYPQSRTNVTLYQRVTGKDGDSSWLPVSTGIDYTVYSFESSDNSMEGPYICKAWEPSEGRRKFAKAQRRFRVNVLDTSEALPSGTQPGVDQVLIDPLIVLGSHPEFGYYKIKARKRTYYIQAGHNFNVLCRTKGYTRPRTNVTIYQRVTGEDGDSSWVPVSTGIDYTVYIFESSDNSTEGRYICKAWEPSEGRRKFAKAQRRFRVNVLETFAKRQYNITLRVISDGKIDKQRPSSNLKGTRVAAGHHFTIKCTAYRKPIPHLALYQDGKIIATADNQRELLFNSTADLNTGRVYTCLGWLPPKGPKLYKKVERTEKLIAVYFNALKPRKNRSKIRKFVVQVLQGRKWIQAPRKKKNDFYHYRVMRGQMYRFVCASTGRTVPSLTLYTPSPNYEKLKQTFRRRVLKFKHKRPAHPDDNRDYFCLLEKRNTTSRYPQFAARLFVNIIKA